MPVTGVMGYGAADGSYFQYQNDSVLAAHHGTGDIFSCVAVGGLMNDLSLASSVSLAADYTADTIRVTLNNEKKPWYGVDFETTIPELVDTLREIKTKGLSYRNSLMSRIRQKPCIILPLDGDRHEIAM